MGRSVTFIHAADLHLGAPFRGLRSLSPAWADVMLHAIPEAYQRVIDAALEQQVDFVVIAGDIFDDSRPSYADFSAFVDGLRRLDEAHIPVYFVTGNHDPYTSWHHDFAVLPKNAHLMGALHADFACFERDGEPLCLIGARGYYNQSWPEGVDISEGISRETAASDLGKSAPFMIGILHTGLDVDPTRSPADPRELLRRDVDYWACGHIHQPRVLPSEADPRIVFSGCPQGRDIRETGEHGIFKVTLEEGHPNAVEFMPTAQVAWQRERLDVSDCGTIADVQELITNTEFARNATARCQRMVFRFTLAGRTPLHHDLTPRILADVRTALNDSYPFFFVDALENDTREPIDTEELRAEGLFPAVFLHAVEGRRGDATATIRDLESEFYERDLTFPTALERELPQLCDEAETLVLDLLSEDGA